MMVVVVVVVESGAIRDSLVLVRSVDQQQLQLISIVVVWSLRDYHA